MLEKFFGTKENPQKKRAMEAERGSGGRTGQASPEEIAAALEAAKKIHQEKEQEKLKKAPEEERYASSRARHKEEQEKNPPVHKLD